MTRPTCPDCGSTDVYIETTAYWDHITGRWEMTDSINYPLQLYCGECGAEFIRNTPI